MRRLGVAVLAGLALAGATAGCSGSGSSPAQKARASATAQTKTVAAPTDCKAAASTGAHDAAFAVQLVLSVDYRNIAQLPAVVEPLLTPAFFASFSSSLAADRKQATASRTANAATIESVAYASGQCAAPTYTVAVVRRTSTTAMGSQTSNLTLRAAMTWSGSTYLLGGLTT